MPQCDVIDPFVVDETAAQHQFVAQHDGAFAAVNRPLHAGVGGQNQGDGWVGRFYQPLHQFRHLVFHHHHNVGQAHARRLFAGHQPALRHPRHGDDLHGDAQFVWPQPLNAVTDVNIWDRECTEFGQRVRPPRRWRHIMVADQQHCRNASGGEA